MKPVNNRISEGKNPYFPALKPPPFRIATRGCHNKCKRYPAFIVLRSEMLHPLQGITPVWLQQGISP
jgi:hypothetical protein